MKNKLVKALKDEAKHPDSKVGASIFNKYSAKIEKADKEDYRKILKDMERELINTHPDTFSGDDEIENSFMSILTENKLVKALKDEARQPLSKEFLRMQKLAGVITESQYKAQLNENVDNEFINFLNKNTQKIFSVIGFNEQASEDEITNAQEYMEFDANDDGINIVYSPYVIDDSSSLDFTDFGDLSFLQISPTPKEFEDQIRYDFKIPDGEEIDFTDREIPSIKKIKIDGRTIYYSIVVY
jgi:hypothetical protein